jgi:soluble lytic murein transglycosylase
MAREPARSGGWTVLAVRRASAVRLRTVLVLALPCVLLAPAAAEEPAGPRALREAVRLGDDARALRVLGGLAPELRQSNRMRYLRARILERQGNVAEALRALGSVDRGALPEPVAQDLDRRRARLHARTAGCEEARPTLQRLADQGGPGAAVLSAQAAECALQLGALDEAERELREVVRRDAPGVDTFAAWLAWAEALWRAGDGDAARDALHGLLVARPEHPEAQAVERQLQVLGGEVRFDAEQRMDRAARYLKLRQQPAALEELDRAGPPADRKGQARWLHLRGMALYQTRHDYAEAARVLDRAARIQSDTTVDDAFHAARALSRAGRTPQAIGAYRRLVRQHPNHRLAAKAEYLAGLLEMGRHEGRGARALQRFVHGPRARRSPGDARGARWHLAMRAYRRGQLTEAAEGFRRYARSGKAALVAGRGHYWRGRALETAGRRAAALQAYREVLAVEARHWYALLAEGRLRALGEPPERPPLPETPPGASANVHLPPAVQFYTDLGLVGDAGAALRAVEAQLRGDGGLDAIVAAHGRIGHWSRAFRLAARGKAAELRRWPDADTRWAWEAAYPRPWRDTVRSHAQAHGVPEALVYAVMRQESGYDPEAVSYAGAVGLMQLMPRTARGLSPLADPVRLFDPRFNVRLGIELLGQLLREFDGSLPLAVAAYNAGSPRVHGWRRADPQADLDLFVENIPIDQTRNYVRRVLSHYASYRLLEGDPTPAL